MPDSFITKLSQFQYDILSSTANESPAIFCILNPLDIDSPSDQVLIEGHMKEARELERIGLVTDITSERDQTVNEYKTGRTYTYFRMTKEGFLMFWKPPTLRGQKRRKATIH